MTKTKILFSVIAAGSVLAFGVARADYNPERWQYFKDIEISGNVAKGSLVEIVLDRDVFGGAKDDLSDLRVVNGAGDEVPVSVPGTSAFKIAKLAPKEITITPSYEAYRDKDKKTSGLIIDLEKKGLPTNTVILKSLDANFNREVVVYESSDKTNWSFLAKGYIFDYDTPKYKGSNMTLFYSESHGRYLKVEIHNGDNAPIAISGLSIKGYLKNALFLYTPGMSYRLYYGNKRVGFPEYDLAKFFPYLDTSYATVTLSGENTNELFKEEALPLAPLSERIPYLLPTTLVVAIAILGFFAYRMIKKA